MKKIIVSIAVIPLLLLGAVVTATPTASAQSVSDAQLADLEAQVLQLLLIIQQLQAAQNATTIYYTTPSAGTGSPDVTVFTSGAEDIDDESVTLEGKIDFEGEDEATVWFEYGRSRSDLDDETIRIVLDEDDDNERFSAGLTDLREDTTYYFRAVAEDENGDRDYGSTFSFKTDDEGRSSSDDDEPEADTDDADDVDNNSAELNGSVDMNDFKNGIVFFAYGEDEDQVEDIAKDYDEYNDIDEDGDDLQVVRVDSDLDDEEDYSEDISGLDDDTDIYFTICVEYEDEDDDETIECGSVEEFETDAD